MPIVLELYEALKQAGVDERIARAAASAVVGADRTELATKADLLILKGDLRREIAELENRLAWRVFMILGFLTIVYTAVNAGLRFVKP